MPLEGGKFGVCAIIQSSNNQFPHCLRLKAAVENWVHSVTIRMFCQAFHESKCHRNKSIVRLASVAQRCWKLHIRWDTAAGNSIFQNFHLYRCIWWETLYANIKGCRRPFYSITCFLKEGKHSLPKRKLQISFLGCALQTKLSLSGKMVISKVLSAAAYHDAY